MKSLKGPHMPKEETQREIYEILEDIFPEIMVKKVTSLRTTQKFGPLRTSSCNSRIERRRQEAEEGRTIRSIL